MAGQSQTKVKQLKKQNVTAAERTTLRGGQLGLAFQDDNG
jgi:hypothetical protein